MKIKIIIIALTGGSLFFAACGGDHSSSSGKDTLTDTYGVGKDTSKLDTGKVASPDHTASGGTDLLKETGKKD